MPDMDGWDWFLLAIGAFVALSTLIGLMRVRRNVVLDEISAQAASEKRRHEQENKRKK